MRTNRRSLPTIQTWHLLLTSFTVHLVLLIYADHVDSHPERYGGLKYTDVDWRVVSDGAKLIFGGGVDGSNRATGWLTGLLQLPIGDPYKRSTFRYTPLLPLLLSPTVLHPLAGKLVLTVISLFIPSILLWDPRQTRDLTNRSATTSSAFWPVHLLWTLNPFVLNITTRGSPEAIIVFFVAVLLACTRALQAARRIGDTRSASKWEARAAVTLALAISYKIYPVIYVPTLWTVLARYHGWLGWGVWRFGLITAASLLLVNGALWSIWGQPFLEHTFLYHLHRLDHRHNFSPYFYPIYLSFFPDDLTSASSALQISDLLLRLRAFLRHPLVSFIPQNTLVLLVGFLLPGPHTSRNDRVEQGAGAGARLEMTMFLQTAMFVVFNKVCTSQYFTWFLPLLAPLIPSLRPHFSRRRTISLITAWILAQALWLGMAYRLEFLGRSVHLEVWGAGVVLFGVSVVILGEIMEGYGRGFGKVAGPGAGHVVNAVGDREKSE